MPLPNLQVCLQPRVTLTFDLQTPKVDRFIPFPVEQICQLASKSLHSFLQCHVHEFNHGQPNGQINGRTDGRTNGHIEIIMPPPASLTWCRHKNSWDLFSEDSVSVTGCVCCVDVEILGILWYLINDVYCECCSAGACHWNDDIGDGCCSDDCYGHTRTNHGGDACCTDDWYRRLAV